MAYSYREDLTFADMAFDAEGETAEELLKAAVDATVNLMVMDLDSLRPIVRRDVQIESSETRCEAALSELLYELLQKIIYYKDAESLLLRAPEVRLFQESQGQWKLQATLLGEEINGKHHDLGTDVKGVTFHKYDVVKSQNGWKATVVLDT